MMGELTHLNAHGAARMVDVSEKPVTAREACAEAIVSLSRDAFQLALTSESPKGDILTAARIAGIMAAKKTAELIPLCHPIPLSKASIDFEPLHDQCSVRILSAVRTSAQTGVEMEAMVAASVAALTIYDMVKAIDRSAAISNVRLLSKSGGKSGTYVSGNVDAVSRT